MCKRFITPQHTTPVGAQQHDEHHDWFHTSRLALFVELAHAHNWWNNVSRETFRFCDPATSEFWEIVNRLRLSPRESLSKQNHTSAASIGRWGTECNQEHSLNFRCFTWNIIVDLNSPVRWRTSLRIIQQWQPRLSVSLPSYLVEWEPGLDGAIIISAFPANYRVTTTHYRQATDSQRILFSIRQQYETVKNDTHTTTH